MISNPTHKSTYTLIWGIAGFVLSLIGWKILIIPIEAVEGLLPDLPIQMLWRDVGWGIGTWSFAVGVFILLGFILEPWGSKGRLFQGRYPNLIIVFLILSVTFTMPPYWRYGPQGVLIGSLHIVWAWTAILSALGIIIGIAGMQIARPWRITSALTSFWNWLINLNPVWLILAVAVWLLWITGIVSWQIFGAIPHVGDSVCQIFVAKTFLHGQLWAVPPPLELKPFFFETFLEDTNKWYSQYLPGYAILLIPMVLLKSTWLLNPLLTALTVPIAYLIGTSIGDDRTGKYTILTLAICPFIIFMSGGQMNHPAMLFWASFAVLSILKSRLEHQPPSLRGSEATKQSQYYESNRWWLFLCGLAMAMGIITRPLTGLAMAVPIMLYWINTVTINRAESYVWLRQLFLIGFGAAGPLIFLMIYNLSTTGNPFLVGYSVVWQGHTTLGFGDSSWGPPHTPALGFLNTINHLNGLNRYLFEMPFPALIGVGLYLIFRNARQSSILGAQTSGVAFGKIELMFAIIFAVVAAYFFYFFQDFCYGPRFMYVLVVPLIIIIVLGVRAFITAAEPLGYTRNALRSGVILFGALCLILTLTISIPRQISIYRDIYWDISRQVLDEADRRNLDQAVVFIEDFPSTNRHAQLHALGMGVRDAWYWARHINDTDLDAAIAELGLDPEMAWTPVQNLELLWLTLNKHRGTPPSPQEDAAGGKFFTPYDSGLIAMDPHWQENSIIYARHLGKYNQVLMDRFPDRSTWLYSWDNFAGAFTLKPFQLTNSSN